MTDSYKARLDVLVASFNHPSRWPRGLTLEDADQMKLHALVRELLTERGELRDKLIGVIEARGDCLDCPLHEKPYWIKHGHEAKCRECINDDDC